MAIEIFSERGRKKRHPVTGKNVREQNKTRKWRCKAKKEKKHAVIKPIRRQICHLVHAGESDERVAQTEIDIDGDNLCTVASPYEPSAHVRCGKKKNIKNKKT